MGSCANIYVEHIDHTAISTFHTPSSLWLRYVDNTFCILDKEHVTVFHSHLNSILVFSLRWRTNKTPLFPFLTFWCLVKSERRVTLLIYHSPLPFTKKIPAPPDICIIRHTIPNTRSSPWSKHYSIA